jgi:hypothetical protein
MIHCFQYHSTLYRVLELLDASLGTVHSLWLRQGRNFNLTYIAPTGAVLIYVETRRLCPLGKETWTYECSFAR